MSEENKNTPSKRKISFYDAFIANLDNQDLKNLEFSENFFNKFCEIKLQKVSSAKKFFLNSNFE